MKNQLWNDSQMKTLTLNLQELQLPVQKFVRLRKIDTFRKDILRDVGTACDVTSLGILYLMLAQYLWDNAYKFGINKWGYYVMLKPRITNHDIFSYIEWLT